MRLPTTEQLQAALHHEDPLIELDGLYSAAYGDDYGAWESDDDDASRGIVIVIGTEGQIDLELSRGERGDWEIRAEGQTQALARGQAVARILLQCMPSGERVAERVAQENA